MYTIGGYLYHHGIQGQKWGVRNGPPYPLGAGDHSSAEKKAMSGGSKKETKKKTTSSSNLSSSYGSKSTDKSKSNLSSSYGSKSTDKSKYIKTGAVVAGVAIAAIGTAYLVKSGKMGSLINAGKNALAKNLKDNAYDIVEGFDKIAKPESAEQRLSKCNPLMTNSDRMGGRRTRHNMNCGNTVIANEMRIRGNDVQGGGNSEGMTVSQFASYFDGIHSGTLSEPKIDVPKFSDETENKLICGIFDNAVKNEIMNRGKIVEAQISKQLASQYPKGSRGAMMFTSSQGTHWISWENVRGKIKFENPQDPSNEFITNTQLYFGTYVNHRGVPDAQTRCMRLDDLKIKDTVKEVVVKYGTTDDKVSFNSDIVKGAGFVMKR